MNVGIVVLNCKKRHQLPQRIASVKGHQYLGWLFEDGFLSLFFGQVKSSSCDAPSVEASCRASRGSLRSLVACLLAPRPSSGKASLGQTHKALFQLFFSGVFPNVFPHVFP